MKLIAENQVKAGAAGGVEAVVKAINIHIDNVDVCEHGCCALRNMTNNRKYTDETTQSKQKYEQLRTK